MIYVDNSARKQTVMFPRYSEADVTGGWSLAFEQPQAGVRYIVARTEIAEAAGHYVPVTFRLPDVVSAGEYVYTLTCGGVVVSRGLARIGEYHEAPAVYREAYNVKQYGE